MFILRLGQKYRSHASYSGEHFHAAKDRAESWGHIDLGSVTLLSHLEPPIQCPPPDPTSPKALMLRLGDGGVTGFRGVPYEWPCSLPPYLSLNTVLPLLPLTFMTLQMPECQSPPL